MEKHCLITIIFRLSLWEKDGPDYYSLNDMNNSQISKRNKLFYLSAVTEAKTWIKEEINSTFLSFDGVIC